MREAAENLRRSLRGAFEGFDLRQRVVERGCAGALAGVGGVEELLLRGERSLQALLLVACGKPGVEGQRSQEEHGAEGGELKQCVAGHRKVLVTSGEWLVFSGR